MPESKKPASGPKRIIDVTHADKTLPSDTSKPVIITNRPILKDPMMSGKSDIDETAPDLEPAPDKAKVISNAEKLIEPSTAKAEAAAEVEAVETAAEAALPAKSATKPDETPAPDNPPADTPPDLSRGELSTDPAATEDIEASQQAEHEAAVQKLIDGKQYYLPIETIEHRRSKRFVALGIVLSLILAVAWVDVALDANLIHVHGVKPPTHFFSN